MSAVATPSAPSQVDVAVVGAGIVGLAIAWELVRAGRRIALIDPRPAMGATHAAAGMLAVAGEFQFGEPGAAEFARAAAERWPAFIGSLPEPIRDPGSGAAASAAYERVPTLLLGVDQGDRAVLADIAAAQPGAEVALVSIGSRAARRREPHVGPAVTSAYLAEADHRVDPRGLAATLIEAISTAQPSALVSAAVDGVRLSTANPGAEVELAGGGAVTASQVVIANGLDARALLSAWGVHDALRPVFGDILRLEVPHRLRPLLTSTVRGLVRGRPVYLVPRRDGTVVVGATQREHGGAAVSAGGVHDLLCDARELVPAIDECSLLETTARARPATPDHLPLVGRVAPELVVATGTYRNGVLLAPLVAELTRRALDGDPLADWPGLHPTRFGARTRLGARQDASLAPVAHVPHPDPWEHE